MRRPVAVSNKTVSAWAEEIGRLFGYELIVIPRRDIVLSLLEPRNAVLCRTILHISVEIAPELSELIEGVSRSAIEVTAHWFSNRRLADQPLIELRTSRIEKDGRSGEILDFGKLLGVLLEGHRLIIEAPAGRGKTTTWSSWLGELATSCSAVEALEHQEPFINQTLAYHALAMLARLFRRGEIAFHGGFINLATGKMAPLQPLERTRGLW